MSRIQPLTWDPAQYKLFESQRTQPSKDLACRVPLKAPNKILDVGCGPGNSTAVLQERFPDSQILGIDSSSDMIDVAKTNLPEVSFEVFDISGGLEGLGSDYDLVFSNACLQWVPDHKKLIPALFGVLNPEGVLAVQIPLNKQAAIYSIIDSMVEKGEWGNYVADLNISNNLTPQEYFDILSQQAASIDMWETVYYHIMNSHQAIIEWYRGSGLRPYLEKIPKHLHQEFEAELLKELKREYAQQKNGRVIFQFRRFFFVAVQAAE